jgi:hypothetical protein
MADLETMESPKVAGFVDPNYTNKANRRRIEQEEAELDKLMKGEQNEEDTSEDQEPDGETQELSDESDKKDETLSSEERTYKKRYSDLRDHLNKQSAEIKQLQSKLENAETSGTLRPPKSDEDIEAWANEFPDIAAIVETIASKKAEERFSGAEARLQEIDRISEEATRSKLEQEIRAIHPDFDELRDSDAFHDWAKKEPKWVKDALYDNSEDPASVARVIDLYKMHNGLDTKSKKKATKAAASAVVTKRSTKPDSNDTAGHFSESQVHKMTAIEYEKNSDAIMEAIRAGKFTYDMTGGAR